MEVIEEAAIACSERADANTQQMAKQMINSMDKDGNGKITHKDFMEALKQLGYKESDENELANSFEKLNTNRDKRLENDAAVFYYVINHKTAVFCSGCYLGTNNEANNAKTTTDVQMSISFQHANNGTGTGSTVSSLAENDGGDIGSAGVGIAKRGFGLAKRTERGSSCVNQVSDAIIDACTIL